MYGPVKGIADGCRFFYFHIFHYHIVKCHTLVFWVVLNSRITDSVIFFIVHNVFKDSFFTFIHLNNKMFSSVIHAEYEGTWVI